MNHIRPAAKKPRFHQEKAKSFYFGKSFKSFLSFRQDKSKTSGAGRTLVAQIIVSIILAGNFRQPDPHQKHPHPQITSPGSVREHHPFNLAEVFVHHRNQVNPRTEVTHIERVFPHTPGQYELMQELA